MGDGECRSGRDREFLGTLILAHCIKRWSLAAFPRRRGPILLGAWTNRHVRMIGTAASRVGSLPQSSKDVPDQPEGYTATLSLMPSLGALTRSCLVPM